jgi:hypothetical protein
MPPRSPPPGTRVAHAAPVVNYRSSGGRAFPLRLSAFRMRNPKALKFSRDGLDSPD